MRNNKLEVDRLTKHELKEYYWLKANIRKLEERIEELETLAAKQTTGIKNDADARVSHGSHDRLGDVVAQIADLKSELQEELSKAYAAVAKIEKAITELPDREKYLIRARYIELKTWEEIAVEMGYSWRGIHKIHSGALKMLA
jgi:RNA polymerase sigma factor (sigma-70 family)